MHKRGSPSLIFNFNKANNLENSYTAHNWFDHSLKLGNTWSFWYPLVQLINSHHKSLFFWGTSQQKVLNCAKFVIRKEKLTYSGGPKTSVGSGTWPLWASSSSSVKWSGVDTDSPFYHWNSITQVVEREVLRGLHKEATGQFPNSLAAFSFHSLESWLLSRDETIIQKIFWLGLKNNSRLH